MGFPLEGTPETPLPAVPHIPKGTLRYGYFAVLHSPFRLTVRLCTQFSLPFQCARQPCWWPRHFALCSQLLRRRGNGTTSKRPRLRTLRPLPRTKRRSPRIQPARSLHPQPLTPRRPGNLLFHQTKLQLHPTDRRPRRAAEKNMSARPSVAGARRAPTKSNLPSLPPLN